VDLRFLFCVWDCLSIICLVKGRGEMTEDKGAGEEEYTHNDVECSAVVCEICGFNRGYAEGRKSMEKDFKELLDLANRLRPLAMGYFEPIAREFDDWKKARGIE
jgi:hypothetical protein